MWQLCSHPTSQDSLQPASMLGEQQWSLLYPSGRNTTRPQGEVRGASRSQPQPSLLGLKTCACILPRGCKQQQICLRWRRCRRPGLDPWVGKIPWRRKWQPTPVFLPGESHGQRSLAGCSPWGSQRVWHDWTRLHAYVQLLALYPQNAVS